MSVKVGVRIRPFNQREIDLGCKLCVDMNGNMTKLFHPEASEESEHQQFTFDYSFWSHDEFKTDQNGLLVATSDRYSGQQQIFEHMGVEILKNALEGYHCCSFAYGQTGAGKSYSMVGQGVNKGFVPIICEQIFAQIAAKDEPCQEYEINISMMEIYNEKVYDLLIPTTKRSKEGPKMCEHKILGIFVEGISKQVVTTYQCIEQKLEKGIRNRSIAVTEMNSTSSRGHLIISIELKQTIVEDNQKKEKISVISLVDLAGSEKVGQTGPSENRLKEATEIEKSISILGLVITALVYKAEGKEENVDQLYKDSCLTHLMQNTLGGNCKTFMLCTISPACDSYETTLSTLKHAEKFKKIQNKAIINQFEIDKLVHTLSQERQFLRERMQKMDESFNKPLMIMTPERLKKLTEIKLQEKYVDEWINNRQTCKFDKKNHQKEQGNTCDNKIDLTKPHLSNLNEDPQLNRKANYLLEGQTKIGRGSNSHPNTIEIGGASIRNTYAAIIKEDEHFILQPIYEGNDSSIFLNGDLVSWKQNLFHLDRIGFGPNSIFLVIIPGTDPREQVDQRQMDWEAAQRQLYLNKQQVQKSEYKEKHVNKEEEEFLRKRKEQMRELQRILQAHEKRKKEVVLQQEVDTIQLLKKESQIYKKILKDKIQIKKLGMQKFQAKILQKKKQRYYFEQKWLRSQPKCIELNLIAKMLHKNISLQALIMLSEVDDDDSQVCVKKRTVMIKITNKDAGYFYWWDPNTLYNRYYIIKDLFEAGVIATLKNENDPFWDPMTPSLIGRCFIETSGLTYMMDSHRNLSIISDEQQRGKLSVKLIPTDQTGTKNLCDELKVDQTMFQPEEMIEKPFHFLIHIDDVKIPSQYYSTFVEYSVLIDELTRKVYRTKEIDANCTNPNYSYRCLHSFSQVTDSLMKHLVNSKIFFKIFGCERIEKQKKKEAFNPESKGLLIKHKNKPNIGWNKSTNPRSKSAKSLHNSKAEGPIKKDKKLLGGETSRFHRQDKY